MTAEETEGAKEGLGVGDKCSFCEQRAVASTAGPNAIRYCETHMRGTSAQAVTFSGGAAYGVEATSTAENQPHPEPIPDQVLTPLSARLLERARQYAETSGRSRASVENAWVAGYKAYEGACARCQASPCHCAEGPLSWQDHALALEVALVDAVAALAGVPTEAGNG